MRTKLIVAILSFSTTFGFSAGVADLLKPAKTPQTIAQTERSTARKITALLRQDVQNGKECAAEAHRQWWLHDSQNAIERLILSTEATIAYVDKMESIDDSDLPADFQTAWRAHTAAWRERADLLTKRKNTVASSDDFSFKKSVKDSRKTISLTWYKVLRIGAEHGAYIPGDAY